MASYLSLMSLAMVILSCHLNCLYLQMVDNFIALLASYVQNKLGARLHIVYKSYSVKIIL